MNKFDEYENDILKSFERDEWVSVDDIEQEKKICSICKSDFSKA